MENPRLLTLLESIEFNQNLAVYYISKMKDVDPEEVFMVNGQAFNSLFWLVGHLAWAENKLVLEGTKGDVFMEEILQNFKFNAEHNTDIDISFSELKLLAEKIHLRAMDHLKTLNDADLDRPNTLNFKFGREANIETILLQFIRHLGTHTGQLSWLFKMYGIKTV